MSNVPPYTRSYSFDGYQEQNPNRPLPGDRLDTELDNVSENLREFSLYIDALEVDPEAIETVATNILDIQTVAGMIDNVNTLAPIADEIFRVANIDGSVTIVAGEIAAVVEVSEHIDDVVAAVASAASANNSKNAAAASQSAAAASASAASTSASTAATSRSQAATSATNAASSATTANNAATAAGGSAGAAAASATAAAGSATSANNSKNAAAASASAAATSQTSAATSASDASVARLAAQNAQIAAAASAAEAQDVVINLDLLQELAEADHLDNVVQMAQGAGATGAMYFFEDPTTLALTDSTPAGRALLGQLAGLGPTGMDVIAAFTHEQGLTAMSAVGFIAQSLTPEQQGQARGNIGAMGRLSGGRVTSGSSLTIDLSAYLAAGVRRFRLEVNRFQPTGSTSKHLVMTVRNTSNAWVSSGYVNAGVALNATDYEGWGDYWQNIYLLDSHPTGLVSHGSYEFDVNNTDAIFTLRSNVILGWSSTAIPMAVMLSAFVPVSVNAIRLDTDGTYSVLDWTLYGVQR